MIDLTTQAIVRLETAVWDALVCGDAQADAALLSEDFLGVYPTGFANRADHATQLLEGPTVATYAVDKAVTRVISPDNVLLSYEATFHRQVGARPETMFVSSLWSRIDGEWLNVFSQDTPADPSTWV